MISRNGCLSAFTLVAFLFSSVTVRAAEPPDAAQYRSLLADAVSEYEARRFDEARALFRRANDLSPNARTLRGIGMASFELRDYVEAYRALQGSLADKRKPLTPEQRRQIEALLERTKAFTGHFGIRTIPLDSIVRIDGEVPFIEQDGRVTLGLGRHSIAVDAIGRIGEVRDIHVFGGENRDLEFQLRLIEPPLASTTLETTPAAPTPAPDTEGHRLHPAWWLVGGGVLAAGAVATGIAWHSQEGQLDLCHQNAACRNEDTLTTERNWTRGATIGLGIAALGLGITGAVLWARSGSKPDNVTPVAVPVACAPSLGAVACQFVF